MIHRFLIGFLLLSSSISFSQETKDTIARMTFLKSVVTFLANDSLYGRPTSSIYESKAADFIFQSFKSTKGLKPKRQTFKFQQADTSVFQQSQNIYCYINNHADSTLLIGAHYDHIGYGGGLSLAYSKKNQIHNGADDNASGVSLMLALSKQAKSQLTKKYNYVFVAYSAHEIGLYGSTAFYTFIQSKVKPIALMINFDMVGRMDKSSPVLSVFVSTQTSSRAANYFKQLKASPKIYLDYNTKITNSDCRIFDENGIEAISLTTGIHTDYHKPSDDEEKINYAGMEVIYKILVEFINR
jgi:Zn-dependent M28 family amino/carboxypeptidase